MADVASNDNNVVSKTTATTTVKPIYIKNTERNPLDAYRSYTYIFTLAALKAEALKDPEGYRKSSDYYIIARSSGKGTAGLIPPGGLSKKQTDDLKINVVDDQSADIKYFASIEKANQNRRLVENFNAKSPGRFDFYINNVEIETIMSPNNDTNLSIATKLTFDIFEPYSMTGLIEALQVSAVAAGHTQYINCPYLLKMEFIGYPDGEEVPETAQLVPFSERYFVFSFTSIDIDVTQEGARYKCTGVPHNERAFGEPSQLKNNITIKGTTVGELLTSFETELNNVKNSNTAEQNGATGQVNRDKYEIKFPTVQDDGTLDFSRPNPLFVKATMGELLKKSAVYSFPESVRKDKSTTVRFDLNNPAIQFNAKSNVHECIIAVIRDSTFTTNITENFPKGIDQYGMFPYFIVNLEVEELGPHDEKTNKPFYKYRYVVLPYRVHYSRIPLTPTQTIDTSKLKNVVARSYDYIYTGNNTDIKSFNLKFNTLFFQAIPIALGNKHGVAAAAASVGPPDDTKTKLATKVTTEQLQKSALSKSEVRENIQMAEVTPDPYMSNAGQQQNDPYLALARNMHQAILDNVDQCQAEIDIIGDPFYLVTAGMGNFKPKFKAGAVGVYENGEAAYNQRDVVVLLTFRNPVDIDENTGEAIFNNAIAPYSGLFRVITVNNSFKDGVFSQRLKLIRFPSQYEDTKELPPPPNQRSLVNTEVDPANTPTEAPAAPTSGIRPSANGLLESIAAGFFPTGGLPGDFSKLVSSVGGNLVGFQQGVTTVGGILNQFAGGAGGVFQGLEKASSVMRLTNSGLGAASSFVNSAAGSILETTNLAKSAGITNVANLAEATINSSVGAAKDLSSAALSKAKNLGDQAAGLMSSVASNVDKNLKTLEGSFATQMGVDLTKLSGLSSALKTKATEKFTELANSIPDSVDLNKAMQDGLIVNNIPKENIGNIPATQPESVAPEAETNLADVEYILSKGGTLANITGAAKLAGLETLTAGSKINFPPGLGLDASSVADKIGTMQRNLTQLTGNYSSVEQYVNNVSSKVPLGLPNVASVENSVQAKFGTKLAASSPLDIIMKSST